MPPSDFPRYTPAAQLGNKGVRIVERIVHDELKWIFREQEGQKDFGIDAHIELMDRDRVLGRMLAVQIKCGLSFFNQQNQEGYVFYGEQKHLNYFLNYPIPVILILCNPETQRCWWCKIDALEMESTKSGWQITVPFEQNFDLHSKSDLEQLAGPAKNYIPELEHYWSVNNLLQKSADTLLLVVAREDIESQELSGPLAVLNRLRVTKSLMRDSQDKVDLSVFGYDNDPRELWEILEVRAWMRMLDEEFPYWFFFLSKHLPGLAFITFALCEFQKRADGKFVLDKQSLANFIRRHFVAMNEICESLGFSEDKIRSLSDAVFSYYKGDLSPRFFHLSD